MLQECTVTPRNTSLVSPFILNICRGAIFLKRWSGINLPIPLLRISVSAALNICYCLSYKIESQTETSDIRDTFNCLLNLLSP